MCEVDSGWAVCGEGWEPRLNGVGGEDVAAREGDVASDGWDCFMARSAADGEKSADSCAE